MPERVGALVAVGGRVRRAADADRVHDEEESARHSADPLQDQGARGRRHVPDAIGTAQSSRAGLRLRLVLYMDGAEWTVGADARADAGQLREADGVVDRV